jgi:hypothetical protein
LNLNTDYIWSIYKNYLTVKDSIKVTRRSLAKEISVLHNRTIFEDLNIKLVSPELLKKKSLVGV